MSHASGSFFSAPGNVVVYNPVTPSYYDAWDDPFQNVQPIHTAPHHALSTSLVNARIDWKETLEGYVFKANVPGFNINEVKVEVEDGRVLCISGEKKIEKEEMADSWRRVERCSGKFVRRFRLPDNARADNMKACMENIGVLTVIVPKEDMKKQHPRTIDIAGIKKYFKN